MAVANLVSLERVHKAYGVRPLLDDVSLGVGATDRIGVVGRNGDGKTTLLKLLGGLEEPDEGRVSRNRGLRLGYLTQGDDLDPQATVRRRGARGPRRPRVGRRPLHPRGRRGAARRGLPRPGRRGPVRRGAPALLAGPAAARRPRPRRPRRAHQPPRRRGGRLAGPAPDPVRCPSYVRAGGGHPRPLVPRRGLHHHVGGARRRRGRVRRRVRRLRAGQGRAAAAGVGVGGPPAEPDAQGARLAAPRGAGPHVEAEVPDGRGLHPDRGRAGAARPSRAAAVRHPAARQGRHRHRGRRPGPRRAAAALARHLAPRARRPRRPGRRQRGRQDLRAAAGGRRARADPGTRPAGPHGGAGAPHPGAGPPRPAPTGCSTRWRRCSG